MNNVWNYFVVKRFLFLKCFILIVIAFFFLGRAFNELQPYATGDGPEYILTTEALYNHGSPDIRLSDAVSFKSKYCQYNPWQTNLKAAYFDEIADYLSKQNAFKNQFGGIYTDRSGKNYGYHFYFYSLLNVPGRFIADKVGTNPMYCFQVTNAFFIIITCFFLLFITPFSFSKSILFTLSFCFSTVYWYLGWTHPEVYTVVFVTIGLFFFFQNRRYLGIILVAIAGLQNQPLLVLLVFMCLKTLIDSGFTFKNIFKTGLCASIILWPPIFYFMHFDTTNLVADAGYLSTEYITLTRVAGFYTDVNQGMILAIPLVLLLYGFFFIRYWVLFFFRKKPFNFTYLLPVFLMVMTCIVTTMGNWNPAQAIVNRYITWFSAIILVHVFFITDKLSEIRSLVIMNYIFITQTFTTLYHQQFNEFDWYSDSHRPLAKWFLDYHPELYNPDPQIFIIRTTRNYNLNPDVSPVFYIRDFNTVTKMAVHKDKIKELKEYGFSEEELFNIAAKLKFVNGWAYLNKNDIHTSKTGAEIYQIMRKKRALALEQRIRSNSEWMQQEQEKSKNWNMNIDEVISRDAAFLLEQEEKEK